ncbi:uncharacterized protein TRIADDRAFT_57038 [Trichoplax adhaerens]|uniref:Aminopeptidase n=1 Tax=Trichoplax adhaerens TaxID=10228 RepID=B3S0G3_TRIAD|nr:hypothetical protein TRIADDRAFT_57038 [Trichoplax adhaerens]EDV23632.1 hypothetical protein TRIADDRAFT_57038 [Trichoplax adhaerens]|eukprot:XP_002113158.1 hypothetical protein TRIADDRAFT_57038 [Trichoplax adhaerens]
MSDVPYVEFEDADGHNPHRPFFITYRQTAIGVIVFIILAVSVGLIAGLTASGRNQSANITTTSMPLTTAVPTKYAALAKPRLPTSIKPKAYYYQLDIDMTKLNFVGINTIQFMVKSSTNIIIVHVSGIKMLSAPQVSNDRNFNGASTYYKVIDTGNYKPNSYYYVVLQNKLTPGTYYIRFNFTAQLASDLLGLYKYQYTRASDRQKIWAIASQGQDFYTRRMIPCFDEPALKATFQATIIVPSNYSVRWNMPVTKKTAIGNKMRYEHSTSPIMSTYLLALAVDGFTYVEGHTTRNTRVRVWSRPSIRNDSYFSLRTIINITQYYEGFFGIPYPISKQDHVAVPKFYAGAMENWGLNLYREEILTYNPYYVSSRLLKTIIVIISHELCHQWLGNYVTIQWWNHMWITESFCNFYQFYAGSILQPSFFLKQQFVTDSVQVAMLVDATRSSHPLVLPPNLGPIFDKITYEKGGSIFRMLRDYIGPANYHTGVKALLKKYLYSNIATEQVFQAISGAIQSPINISDFMGPWVYQMGYPLVTLIRHPGNRGLGIISQQRYLTNSSLNPSTDPPGSPYPSTFGYKWTIPIRYYNSGDKTTKLLVFDRTSASVQIGWPANTWIKLNTDEIGFYRVNYPTENWQALAMALQTDKTQFSETDIANMLDDAFQLAQTYRINYMIPLNLTKYLFKETNQLPWGVTSLYYSAMFQRLSNRGSFQYFSKYFQKIAAVQADRFGFSDNGNWIYKEARATVLEMACSTGYKPCIANATAIFKKYMQNPTANNIKGTIRGIVFKYGIENGGATEWNFLFKQYKQSLNIADRRTMLRALSATKIPWLIRRFLNYTVDPTKIPSSSMQTVLLNVNRNTVGRYFTWEFLRDHQNFLMQKFKTTRSIVRIITQNYDTPLLLNQVMNYFKMFPENSGSAKSTEASIIQRIKSNMQYLHRCEKLRYIIDITLEKVQPGAV